MQARGIVVQHSNIFIYSLSRDWGVAAHRLPQWIGTPRPGGQFEGRIYLAVRGIYLVRPYATQALR